MQKNDRITALRGVFIMMIVLHHLGLYDGGGTLGVTFFFMLGGLALSMGYYDKVCNHDFSYISFVKKRCGKFYPLHWLCLLVVLPLSLLPLVRGVVNAKTALAPLIPNFLLLQSLIPSPNFYFSFNAVSWYLSNTMLFGLFFPVIVKIVSKLNNAGRFLVLAIMLFVYSTLVYLLPIEYWHAVLYISPLVRIMDFILGIYLYLLYKKLVNHKVTGSCLNGNWSKFLVGLMVMILIEVSCITPTEFSLISAIYWIPISILLIITLLPPPPHTRAHTHMHAVMEGNYIIWLL